MYKRQVPKTVERKPVFYKGDNQEETYTLHGAVGAILASIPTENMGDSDLLRRVAGSMPVIAKLS